MKKFYFSALMAIVAPVAMGQQIYKSDMTDWTRYNLGNGSPWENWWGCDDGLFQSITPEEEALSGCDDGIVCKYDDDYSSDAWAVSPAVALEAGETYKIGVFVRDEGDSYSCERWKIMCATSSSLTSIRNGHVIIDRPNHNDIDLKEYTAQFTPETSGDYYFGINCYSEAAQYGIYATGFNISKDPTVGVGNLRVLPAEEAAYYDLQGRRAEPVKGGIYMMKKGDKTCKVIF